MSSPKDNASPFGPGFERDGRILLLALSEKAITRGEFRRNFARMGVELDPEPGPGLTMTTPSLQRPSLEPQPELYLLPDDPEHMFDPATGLVYRVADGELVGQLEMPGEIDGEIAEPPAEIAAAGEQIDDEEATDADG